MIIALENIRSLYNIGSIFRTMSFFGLKQVLLVGYSGRKKPQLNKLHKKIKKTALGAEKDLKIDWIKNGQELINFSQKNKLKLIAIEQAEKAVSLKQWRPTPDSILVLGNEVNGVSQEVLAAAEKIIEIPCFGKKNSLNVEVAAAIVMAKLLNQF